MVNGQNTSVHAIKAVRGMYGSRFAGALHVASMHACVVEIGFSAHSVHRTAEAEHATRNA